MSRELAARAPGTAGSMAERLLRSPKASTTLGVLAAAEQVADKLAPLPPRTVPPALLVRAASGGLSAVALASGRVARLWPLALAGALGAVVGAHLFLVLRRRLAQRTGMPDAIVGTIEDVVAMTLAERLTHRR